MAQPRLLHLTVGLGFGGAEIQLERLIRADEGRRQHWVVGLIDDTSPDPLDTYSDRLLAIGATPVSLGFRRGRLHWTGLLRLARLLREIEPDLLVGWMYHGNAVVTALSATHLLRIPFVWNIRCALDSAPSESALTAALIRFGALAGRLPRAIVYNSQKATLQHEALGYPAEKSVVVANGFDTRRLAPNPAARAAWRARLGVADDERLVGMAARLHPLKDHETFIAAAAQLAERRPDTRFVLAGLGVETLAQAAATAPSIARLGPDRLRLLGHVSDMPGFLNALDIHALSSLSEGFPNAVGEAMACGVPCVATDVGDTALLMGGLGALAPLRRSDALAKAIGGLLDLEADQREALAAASRRRIVEEFSIDAAYAKFDRVWSQCARPARREFRPGEDRRVRLS